MPNVSEKKLKLLYIAQLLLEKTDEDHAVTLPQMLEMLEAKGIPAERKSLYDDLETLRRFGFPIETRKSRTFAYYLSQRTFSPGDVALLAEAVRQAPGLSPRKVSQLLKKLGTLCSQYQAQALLSGGPAEEPPTQEETVPEPAAPSPEELLRRAIQREMCIRDRGKTRLLHRFLSFCPKQRQHLPWWELIFPRLSSIIMLVKNLSILGGTLYVSFRKRNAHQGQGRQVRCWPVQHQQPGVDQGYPAHRPGVQFPCYPRRVRGRWQVCLLYTSRCV